MRRVLNTGCGPPENTNLHALFTTHEWQDVRLDIDPRTRPDLVGTIDNMREIIPDTSFDAIWSSHNIEHLYSHQVLPAFKEFRRILKPEGFAFVTCPDLTAVCRHLLEHGLFSDAYVSPVGPITPIDMLYGHARSIAAGNTFMCHNTGFTAETLGGVSVEAGFLEARIAPGRFFDIYAILLLPGTDVQKLKRALAATAQSELL